ncbi:MAG TPA: phosphoribosylformylglycinamidine synthase subunit PurQ [Thermoanaerobaculia bacterium]|jgi:phosphoribosylformylglycinamidine synthase|nr:phosphoribosylformylglycinamidine synthase subunit PurQ [Thermoanaerobaculia bacterium]
MKVGVVVFPGSNCDHDVYHAFAHVLSAEATFLWHGDETIQGCDLVVLPGGFAYGDYLRAGALAALSPVMAAVGRHAREGGLVLGICNGFQVLLEAGLLPGAMRRNQGLRFLCQDVYLRVERNDLPFTSRLSVGQVLRLPIAHAEGNYEDAPERLDALEDRRQVVFRYCAPDGEICAFDTEQNPNGAARAIAGVANERGNVLGLMPHPERAVEAILGNADGLAMLAGTVEAMASLREARA